MKMTMDLRAFDRMIQQAQQELTEIRSEATDYFRKITPRRSGNAQRRTRQTSKGVFADYGYAQRLDEGWSRQAPDGMSEPTIKELERTIIPRAIRRINRGN